jgi:uncharacterized protein YndB with AHSA1/START domain
LLSPRDYERLVKIRAPRTAVFDALATIDGVRGWWSTDVSGSAAIGDVLRFGFTLPTHQEWIVMRVDGAERPSRVAWSCVAQYVAPKLTKHDEWVDTRLTFDLAEDEPDVCALHFRHAGLTPALECYEICAPGWDYFLASLAAYVEQGEGTPFDR